MSFHKKHPISHPFSQDGINSIVESREDIDKVSHKTHPILRKQESSNINFMTEEKFIYRKWAYYCPLNFGLHPKSHVLICTFWIRC